MSLQDEATPPAERPVCGNHDEPALGAIANALSTTIAYLIRVELDFMLPRLTRRARQVNGRVANQRVAGARGKTKPHQATANRRSRETWQSSGCQIEVETT
jgi:hypothetical protein